MKHRTTPLLALALTIFLGELPSVEAQPIPSGAVACYFVARAYLDPVNGQGEVRRLFHGYQWHWGV